MGKSSDFKEIEKRILEDSVAYLNGVTAYREIVIFIYDESASVQEHDTTPSSLRGISASATSSSYRGPASSPGPLFAMSLRMQPSPRVRPHVSSSPAPNSAQPHRNGTAVLPRGLSPAVAKQSRLDAHIALCLLTGVRFVGGTGAYIGLR